MPTISMFYGIVIYMFFFDHKKHPLPHIHATYGEDDAIFSISDGELLEGDLPKNKLTLVQVDRDSPGGFGDRLASGGPRSDSAADQTPGVNMEKVIFVRPLLDRKLLV